MNNPDVLLYLVNFELIAAIPDRSVVLLIMDFVLLGGIVEEFIPIEFLVVSTQILTKADRFVLRNAQLHAYPLNQLPSRYFLSSEEVPNKRNLADYHLHITIPESAVFLMI